MDLSPKVKSGTPVQSYFGMQLWNEQGTKVWDVPVSNVYDSVPLASPTLPAGRYYIRFTKPADGSIINMMYVISLPGYEILSHDNTDLDAEALDWSTSYTGDVFYHNGGALLIDSKNHIISGTPVQSYYTLKVFNKDTGALVWSINFDNQFDGDYVTSPSLPAGNYYIYLIPKCRMFTGWVAINSPFSLSQVKKEWSFLSIDQFFLISYDRCRMRNAPYSPFPWLINARPRTSGVFPLAIRRYPVLIQC